MPFIQWYLIIVIVVNALIERVMAVNGAVGGRHGRSVPTHAPTSRIFS